jgi:polar amino acid transport system substrate-binding protein
MPRRGERTAFAFLVSGLVWLATGATAGETIRITNGDWPPFQSEKMLLHHGVLSRIVTEAFALEGITVEYGFFPWRRARMNAQRGVWDGSMAWAYRRPDFVPHFLFSDPIVTVPKTLFFLKSHPVKWNSIEDLRGLRIGITAGYTYGEDFDRAAKDGVFAVEEVTRDEQNLRKLLKGRLDAVAMEIDVALFFMQTELTPEEAGQIVHGERLLMEAPMCAVFPKCLEKSPRLVEALNRGLSRLRESGLLDTYIRESREGRYMIKPDGPGILGKGSR